MWRIRCHPVQQDCLVAACMHKGCAIVKADVLFGHDIHILHLYDAHESLTYDAEWVRLGKENLVASCSFYDSMLHFWQAKESVS